MQFYHPPIGNPNIMAPDLTNLSFEEWVIHVFDHAAAPTDPVWYHAVDAAYWGGPPGLVVTYLTRLFQAPWPLLTDYSDEQVNQGLWYIVSNGCSDYMFALADESVPLPSRLACIHSFLDLFRQVFVARCTPHLSHLDEPGANPLNQICYMWWDAFPLGGDPTYQKEALTQAMLEVMEQSLYLPSIACQEGALHGLGHWAGQIPQTVQPVIDQWLATQPSLRTELRHYAQSARLGCVQ